MRQHRPGAAWQGRLRTAPRRPGIRPDGRIVDLTDAAYLPQRDRVQLTEPGWRFPRERPREARPPWGGEIVDDFLDGRRVYPEPPHRSRPVDRLGRLLHRVSAPMWFFVLLACLQAGVAVADVLSSGLRSTPAALSLTLQAVYACTLTLLPAGVLMWRADAWRSARLVLVGAIVWTTIPSVAGLGWWFVRRIPALDDRLGLACALAMGIVAVVACFGPMAIAFGLERARRTRAEWLWPLTWQAGVLMTMPMMYSVARWLPLAGNQSTRPAAGDIDTLRLSSAIAGAAEPLELLGLGVLACLCVSSVLAQEPQRRLWQCAAAGAVSLFGVSLCRFFEGALLGAPVTGDLEGRGWFAVAATAGLVVGGALMVLAFTSTVWSAARDAEGRSHGAPDEIFAWGPSGWSDSEPIPMDAIVAVAAGADHALALDRHGRVGAWGDDSMGQIDVPDGLSAVIAVAAGDGFSLALQATGTVVAWGANARGQTDVPDDLTGVTAIAAGREFALALRSDGSVVGWGDAASGALPVPPGLSGVTAISAGAYHALALRVDGSVVAWGDNGYGQSSVPARLLRAKAISAGGDFSLALRVDGSVVAWGDNGYGQLDIPEGLANVTAISAGAFHAVALLAHGDVIGWGGGRKQGEADHPWRLVDFKAVAAGDGFSLAIRAA